MDLIIVILIAVGIGFLVWLLTESPNAVKMPPGYARTIQIGVLLILIVWILATYVPILNILPRR